jgi:hypothetical protein
VLSVGGGHGALPAPLGQRGERLRELAAEARRELGVALRRLLEGMEERLARRRGVGRRRRCGAQPRERLLRALLVAAREVELREARARRLLIAGGVRLVARAQLGLAGLRPRVRELELHARELHQAPTHDRVAAIEPELARLREQRRVVARGVRAGEAQVQDESLRDDRVVAVEALRERAPVEQLVVHLGLHDRRHRGLVLRAAHAERLDPQRLEPRCRDDDRSGPRRLAQEQAVAREEQAAEQREAQESSPHGAAAYRPDQER